MRRTLAAVLVTAIAVLGPTTAAHAEPAERPASSQTQVLWPLCVTLAGWTACIPA